MRLLNKADRHDKRDRTARLLNVEHLLYQYPKGLMIEEIARLCGVSKRTSYRDLKALESDLSIPIWEAGSKRGIVEGYLLPPIHFTPAEALNIFLAARLMLHYTHRYDPNIASTFMKLNSIVPPLLREQIQKTMDWMRKQPRNERYLSILATLTEAWLSQRRVKISYRALAREKATERIIEPYCIEPAPRGHAGYVIAYCHLTSSLRTFKIERMQAIEPSAEPYIIPLDFDSNALLSSAWGIVFKGETKTIRLKFVPQIAQIIEETIWHPSQVVEKQDDDSVIMTLKVSDTVELRSWIMQWGEKVEVLEPAEIREKMVNTAEAILDVYKKQ
jgi:predicted DNA-binding transcriptional regulator YafY